MNLLTSRFWKIGHRGAAGYIRGNTIASFRMALASGVDAVEMDVRKTADDVLVIHHDEKIKTRRIGGHKKVADLTFGGIRKSAPALRQITREFNGKTRFVFDLKERKIEETLAKFIKENKLDDQILFVATAFPESVLKCKKLMPRIPVLLAYPRDIGDFTRKKYLYPLIPLAAFVLLLMKIFLPFYILLMVKSTKADGVSLYHHLITTPLAAILKRQEIPVFAWVVDNRRKARWLKNLKLNGLVSNKPDILN